MAGLECREAISRSCCNQRPYQQQVRRIAPWKSSVDMLQNEFLGRLNSGLKSSRPTATADTRGGCVCTEVRWQPACFRCAEVLTGSLSRETENRFEREGERLEGGPWLYRSGECMIVACVASNNESHGDEDLLPPVPEENCAQKNPPVAISESRGSALTADLFFLFGIFLFAAGVVDAGFSGDWSRIGVLTKDVEVELQIASIGIVPLSGWLIWSIIERRRRM